MLSGRGSVLPTQLLITLPRISSDRRPPPKTLVVPGGAERVHIFSRPCISLLELPALLSVPSRY